MTEPDALEARALTLRRDIAGHKKAIRDHKACLQASAEELAELEAHAKRLGLGLYVQSGAGGIHGRPRSG